MTRQRYETQNDRAREDWIAERFALKTGVDQIALPANARIDRLLMKNMRPVGWAEIKSRTHECGKYDTYALSARKFKVMHWLHEATLLPSILVVGYMDMIAWVNITKLGGLRIIDGGRTDRDDPADIDKIVLIPIARFSFILPEERL